MDQLTFAQSDKRSLALPVGIAVAVLAVVAGVFTWFNPYRKIGLSVPKATVYLADSTFSRQSFLNGTQVVGQGESTEHDLYVVATVKIENPLRVPLFLKDFTATLTGADGAELRTNAIEKDELGAVFGAFPELKGIAGMPLLRETEVAPGTTVEGTVLLQMPIAREIWDKRRSASLTVAFYHQDAVTAAISGDK